MLSHLFIRIFSLSLSQGKKLILEYVRVLNERVVDDRKEKSLVEHKSLRNSACVNPIHRWLTATINKKKSLFSCVLLEAYKIFKRQFLKYPLMEKVFPGKTKRRSNRWKDWINNSRVVFWLLIKRHFMASTQLRKFLESSNFIYFEIFLIIINKKQPFYAWNCNIKKYLEP